VLQNPPTVFARQANVTQGPQQVNNIVAAATADAILDKVTRFCEQTSETRH
jgi:hypothetical protein